MSAALAEREVSTLADVLDRLGGIPADRVLLDPRPGTATERDLLRLPSDVQKLCELVDGTLVMKAMGAQESSLGSVLIGIIYSDVRFRRKFAFLGPDGHTRYLRGQIRMPDVSLIDRDRLPDRKLPKEAICPFPPDLAVEVLSVSNRRKEIEKKLKTFFKAGVRLAWIADPRKRTVRIYHSAEDFVELTDKDFLDGEDVLPGFKLSIREWFDAAE